MRKKLSPFWILFILTGLNLFNYIDRYVLSSVLEQIKGSFRLSDTQAGGLGTAFMLGYFITSPLFGYLGDRMPRKWLIAGGIFVWSIGTLLTGFATDFWHIVLFRVLIGVGEASYATLSPGLISDSFSTSRRNNAFTVFYVAIPLGAALGVLFGSYVGSHYGWHHAFIWSGAPGLILALVLLPFREPERGEADDPEHAHHFEVKPGVWDYVKLLLIGEYQLIIWGYVAYTFAMGAYAHWAPAFFTRVHHISQLEAGQFFGAVMVVAGLVGTFVGGLVATAWQKRHPSGYAWVIGLSVLLAAPFTLLIVCVSSVALVKLCFAVAVLLLFCSTGPVNTLIIESVPVNLRASAMAGSIFMIHLFGDLWSPLAVGRVSRAFGDQLDKGLLLMPVALAFSALFWIWLAVHKARANGAPSHPENTAIYRFLRKRFAAR